MGKSISDIFTSTVINAAKTLACCGLALLSLPSCSDGDKTDSADDADVLLCVGDSALRASDVLAKIPGGLSQADSAAMFDAIVRAWAQRMLLDEFGREYVDDMERIDRLTEQYRSRLIAQSYRRKIRQGSTSDVSDKSIQEYFDANADSLILDAPIVKGLYVKIPSDAPELHKVKDWIHGAKSSDIDNLERRGLDNVLEYSFFEDRWVDFQDIAEKIPYRFTDPDAFVASTRNFETEYDGNVYILHISSFLRSGEHMPFEYARSGIADILGSESADAYEKRLLLSLWQQALKQGRIKLRSYTKPLI